MVYTSKIYPGVQSRAHYALCLRACNESTRCLTDYIKGFGIERPTSHTKYQIREL